MLSRIESGEAATGIEDKLSDTNLYEVNTLVTAPLECTFITNIERMQESRLIAKVVVKQGDDIIGYLREALYPGGMSKREIGIYAYKARPYTSIGDILYRRGGDNIARRVVSDDEKITYLTAAHDYWGRAFFC